MADDKDAAAPAPDPSSVVQDPNDFSALLETPVYELVEKGADRRGYETRDIRPSEHK
jgi:hypothetical protein